MSRVVCLVKNSCRTQINFKGIPGMEERILALTARLNVFAGR